MHFLQIFQMALIFQPSLFLLTQSFHLVLTRGFQAHLKQLQQFQQNGQSYNTFSTNFRSSFIDDPQLQAIFEICSHRAFIWCKLEVFWLSLSDFSNFSRGGIHKMRFLQIIGLRFQAIFVICSLRAFIWWKLEFSRPILSDFSNFSRERGQSQMHFSQIFIPCL